MIRVLISLIAIVLLPCLKANINLNNPLEACKWLNITLSSWADTNAKTVNGIGDVNGDGIDDFFVSDYSFSNYAGQAYVIYGQSTGFSNMDIFSLTTSQGFTITESSLYIHLGQSASSIGDINGDGIGDFAIEEPGSSTVYVIYGKKGGLSDMLISDMTTSQGFKVTGASANAEDFRCSIDNAGDVNGDGITDLIIGVPDASSYSGAVYVIYGKSGGLSTINLSTMSSSQGFKVTTTVSSSRLGWSVSSAGDINGDHISDIIIGAWGINTAYVIYGKRNGLQNIAIASMTASQGFTITGTSGSYLGVSVSAIEDINHDGISDIIVGAHFAKRAYVIYGKKGGLSNMATSTMSVSQGFQITGDFTKFGVTVRSIGDINGDGIVDILIGATNWKYNEGAAYVVYGPSNTSNLSSIDVSTMNANQGFNISNIFGTEIEIGTVNSAGDVNGDGFTDIIIGNCGQSVYVLFLPPLSSCSSEKTVVSSNNAGTFSKFLIVPNIILVFIVSAILGSCTFLIIAYTFYQKWSQK